EKELRTALAMGCDQAVLINIEDDLDEPDQYSISQVLYHYMKDQEFDLILGGNVAIDGGSGQVAPRLAELLDIPCITTITKLEINGTDAEA
ncbi:electron transfer flavoprotein subunit beta, partial [Xanthomonas citri pv. citri]|nr:electron transfer flavoprotein subunit beta [Xanthomonas citri pv. citri]